jgi:hypothetical protein
VSGTRGGQWTLSIRQADGETHAEIGLDDMEKKLRELNLAEDFGQRLLGGAPSVPGGATPQDAMHLALRVFDKVSNEGWDTVTEQEFGKAQQALYDAIYHARPNA